MRIRAQEGEAGRQRGARNDDDDDEPGGLPGLVDPAIVERGELSPGTVAIRVRLLGRERIMVSAHVPPGETAAVVRHLRAAHQGRCYGPGCGVGRGWSDRFPPEVAVAVAGLVG